MTLQQRMGTTMTREQIEAELKVTFRGAEGVGVDDGEVKVGPHQLRRDQIAMLAKLLSAQALASVVEASNSLASVSPGALVLAESYHVKARRQVNAGRALLGLLPAECGEGTMADQLAHRVRFLEAQVGDLAGKLVAAVGDVVDLRAERSRGEARLDGNTFTPSSVQVEPEDLPAVPDAWRLPLTEEQTARLGANCKGNEAVSGKHCAHAGFRSLRFGLQDCCHCRPEGATGGLRVCGKTRAELRLEEQRAEDERLEKEATEEREARELAKRGVAAEPQE